jgi:hypothetical protein
VFKKNIMSSEDKRATVVDEADEADDLDELLDG